jgi:hypothetical protein
VQRRWRFPSPEGAPRPPKPRRNASSPAPRGRLRGGGTATFEDVSKGSRVRLELSGLPKPDAFYLAHIHPGTCAQGEQEEEDHAGHGGAGAAEEIEWPLMPVRSGTHGDGSSTTTLKNTTTEELFSGRPKHVNVHAAGSGNPPVLTCANLRSRSSSPLKTVEEATTPRATSPTPKGASSTSTAAAASASASSRGGGPSEEQAKRLAEADCRLAIYVAQEKMSRKKAHAFSELLAEMIRTMEGLSWPEGTLRNAALDHLGVPRYPECRKVGRGISF